MSDNKSSANAPAISEKAGGFFKGVKAEFRKIVRRYLWQSITAVNQAGM